MSSRSVVLRGRQVPRLALAPVAEWSHADDAAFLSSSYGLTPDDWQFSVLQAWLGARRNGRWAATTCGLAVPRQNGKNGILEIRELYGMVALGEKFLHTAHEVKTARKAFLRLKSFFENERKYPELAALAVEIRKTNGQEAIVLENGGSVEFVARSRGSGRGFTVDVLVCDEAQELSDEALEALGSTISAAPQQNPQTLFTGTPPGPTMNGEVFTRTRDTALEGRSPRLAWHEWSLVGAVDLDDRENWAATNPALGGRLNVEVIEDERDRYSDEGFARERLGMWADPANEAIIPASEWADLADLTEVPALHVGKVVLGVDSDPGRSRTSVSVAGARAVGPPLVRMVENLPGVDWATAWVAKFVAENDVQAVVIDKRSAAAALIAPLMDLKVPVTGTDAQSMAQACGRFYDAATETRQLRHLSQPELNSAIRAATTRPLGDAWAWDRKRQTADITPLTSATLAFWGFLTLNAPKNAGRGRAITLG